MNEIGIFLIFKSLYPNIFNTFKFLNCVRIGNKFFSFISESM